MRERSAVVYLAAVLAAALVLPGLARAQHRRDAALGVTQFGVHWSGFTPSPEAVGALLESGARCARVNLDLTSADKDFTPILAAGIDLIVTIANRDAADVDTTYGTRDEWPNAGFPYRSRALYQEDVRQALAPLVPYLARGRRIWVQCENEVSDATLAPNSKYWRGTTDQYLTQLVAFFEAVRSVDPSLVVVMSSFTSVALDAVIDPSSPTHDYQVERITKMLTTGQYDAVDLHFYGCVEDIPAKAAWVTDRLPDRRLWITTENGGPDSTCPTTPVTWEQNPTEFERIEAEQVRLRLQASADAGAAVALWFSFFDLEHEEGFYAHLGLIDESTRPPRMKPAFDAFKALVGAPAPAGPALSSLQVLRKGKPVDHLVAGSKARKYKLAVSGSGFDAGTQALVNGTEVSTTVASATDLTASLPPGRVPGPGTMTVQVRDSAGRLSNTLEVEIRAQ